MVGMYAIVLNHISAIYRATIPNVCDPFSRRKSTEILLEVTSPCGSQTRPEGQVNPASCGLGVRSSPSLLMMSRVRHAN